MSMSFVKKTAFIAFCGFLSFLFFSLDTTHAQTVGQNITFTPEFPGPNQTVTILVEDFSRDLNQVEIVWTVNGKIVKKGFGERRLEVTTGNLGSVTNVGLNVGRATQNLSIRPAAVDLIWQADTYTPPFYKGKALHSNQDPLRVVAEPFFMNAQGVRLNPTTLTYRWFIDGKIQDRASGYGKKTFQYLPSILTKPYEVRVEVYSGDSSYKAASTVVIDDTQPEVLFYENHPLYGVLFNTALNGKSLILAEEEVSVIGVPLYFSKEQMATDFITYSWGLKNRLWVIFCIT